MCSMLDRLFDWWCVGGPSQAWRDRPGDIAMMTNVVIMVMTVKVMTMRRHYNDEGSDNVGCRPQSARIDKDQGAVLLFWREDQGLEFHSFPGAELLQYIRADFKGGPRDGQCHDQ